MKFLRNVDGRLGTALQVCFELNRLRDVEIFGFKGKVRLPGQIGSHMRICLDILI